MRKLIAYDFDGTMTDNTVLVSSDGTESVRCSRDDGYAISMFKKRDVEQIIITAEKNHVVKVRARKLDIPLYMDDGDKVMTLMTHGAIHGFDLADVCYLGNGLNDVDVMKAVGHPACVKDACVECKTAARYILSRAGGNGAVLALYRLLDKLRWM
jgi:N-acylneuraminate cytidylyltransferase